MKERFETFTVLIARINRCIHRIKTEEMSEFHLKSSHVSCLYYLYKATSLTSKELCDVCGEDKANISRAIKYLENTGYLLCESTAGKRYQSALTLTEKGRTIGERIARKVDRILSAASAELSEEHRLIMYQSLLLVYQNLNSICEGYTAAERQISSEEIV